MDFYRYFCIFVIKPYFSIRQSYKEQAYSNFFLTKEYYSI